MTPDQLFGRLKRFSIDVIFLCRTLRSFPETRIIQNQLIRSATSAASNYRAANCARSKNEWFAKLSVVLEEMDESKFWLDVIDEIKLSTKLDLLQTLCIEADKLTRLFSKARHTAKMKNYQKKK